MSNPNDTTNDGRKLRGNERFIYAAGYIPNDLAEVIYAERLAKWKEAQGE